MSKPDAAAIHPHATGRALQTVEAHQEPQELVFYAGWVRTSPDHTSCPSRCRTLHLQFCPYVARSWIALEEKGIPYQYVEVNPYKKEKHFLGTLHTFLYAQRQYLSQSQT